jgi:hypothetical protein
MSTQYTYVEDPHVEARRSAGPPTVVAAAMKAHGGGVIGRINSRIGLGITLGVGTMWAAYLFTLLALISLPSAIRSHDPIIIVAWIAQTFLQLVLLPIIIVGQNIQAAAADARAEATYADAAAILDEVRKLHDHLAVQDEALTRLADLGSEGRE